MKLALVALVLFGSVVVLEHLSWMKKNDVGRKDLPPGHWLEQSDLGEWRWKTEGDWGIPYKKKQDAINSAWRMYRIREDRRKQRVWHKVEEQR